MRIRRLGWAGIELHASDGSLVIDYVRDASPVVTDHLTQDHPVAPSRIPADAALVTHLHDDHTDVDALIPVLGPRGVVLRPARFEGTAGEAVMTQRQEHALAASDLDARIVAEWEPHQLGPFTVTAVPAIDGLGDPQVNWVVEADGERVFHGGDTLFHGYWWLIVGRLGPIDVAILPVNGPVIDVPHLQPASAEPAVLTPRQAVDVARILRADTLVPMHYGVDWPDMYAEASNPIATLEQLVDDAGPRVTALAPGEIFDITATKRRG